MSDITLTIKVDEEKARDFAKRAWRSASALDVSLAVAAALPPEYPEGTIAWVSWPGSLDGSGLAVYVDGQWAGAVYANGKGYSHWDTEGATIRPLRVLADDEYAYVIPDSPKMLCETLCVAQARIGNSSYDEGRKREHIDRLQRLIDECDRHRPVGTDGKHGDRHTSTCWCKR